MSVAFVTGASGGYGAHLAGRLIKDGHEVVSLLHDERPYDTASLLDIKDKITWVRGSLLNERLCKRVIADYAVDYVYHLAALPIVQTATRTTTPIFETNLMATVNLLEAVKENAWAGKNIHFVFVSTDKVYGDAGTQPYTEDMPLNALGIYECSKAAADMAVRTYANCRFIPSCVVARPCNLIIPGDMNLGRVLPRMILPLMRGERPTLYKTNYLREFMYVEDGVEGLLALAKALVNKPNEVHGRAFNIGSGEQRTMEQVVSCVLKYFPGLEPNWTEPPALSRIEIPFQKLDTALIKKTVGWEARHTFESSVEDLIVWWRGVWDKLPTGLRNKSIVGWHS